MQKIRNKQGITLTYLVITVIVLLILTSTILISTDGVGKLNRITNMYNDIEILEEKVNIYYQTNHILPCGQKLSEDIIIVLADSRNQNDNNNYYVIDLALLGNISLNYGKGETATDRYIINEQSHTVYYLAGVNLDGVTHYRLPAGYSNLDNHKPNAPEDFLLSATSTETTITVTGQTISSVGLAGYKFRINSEDWTSTQTSNTYTFTGLTPGQTYKVSMKAVDINGNETTANNTNAGYIEITTLTIVNN